MDSFYRLMRAVLLAAIVIKSFPLNAETQSNLVGGLAIQEKFPPYMWVDSCSGSLEGYASEVVKNIILTLSPELKLDSQLLPSMFVMPKEYYFDQLRNGHWRLALYTPKPSSENIVTHSIPVFSTGHAFIFLDSKDFKSIGDLKNHKGKIGSRFFKNKDIQRLINDGFSIDRYEHLDEAVSDLVNGQADYIIADKYIINSRLKANHSPMSIKSISAKFLKRDFYLIGEKGKVDPIWFVRIDEYLTQTLVEEKRQLIIGKSMSSWVSPKACLK